MTGEGFGRLYRWEVYQVAEVHDKVREAKNFVSMVAVRDFHDLDIVLVLACPVDLAQLEKWGVARTVSEAVKGRKDGHSCLLGFLQ